MAETSSAYVRLRRRINGLLVFLVIYDVILSGTCLLRPDLWYRYIHGADYVDPQGLLLRTGAVWVAFSLFQLIARLKWEVQPMWLAVIAGIRLTEVFSDWTYLFVAQNVSAFGWFGLFVNPPMNALLGWYLIRTYRRIHVEFGPELQKARLANAPDAADGRSR
jgi:hypothetical protein